MILEQKKQEVRNKKHNMNKNHHPTYYNLSRISKDMKRLSVQRVQRSGHDSGISCGIL
jgi:hypothetical protein